MKYGSQLAQDSTEAAATQTAANLTAADHTASNQSAQLAGMGPWTKCARICIFSHFYKQAVAFLLAFAFTSTAEHPL